MVYANLRRAVLFIRLFWTDGIVRALVIGICGFDSGSIARKSQYVCSYSSWRAAYTRPQMAALCCDLVEHRYWFRRGYRTFLDSDDVVGARRPTAMVADLRVRGLRGRRRGYHLAFADDRFSALLLRRAHPQRSGQSVIHAFFTRPFSVRTAHRFIGPSRVITLPPISWRL